MHVHVDRRSEPKRRNGNGFTVAAIGAVIGIVIAAVGFFSTYVFVTKAELATHVQSTNGSVHALDTSQKLTDASVKRLASEVKDVKLEQRITNKNLNKLLRRSRITPASRAEMRIEIEGEDQ